MIFENDGSSFELKLFDLRVGFKLSLKNKAVGSSTSSSETLNQGTKAKVISVAGSLTYEEEQHLTDLIKLAEAVKDDGSRQEYTLEDKTANVGDVRQVTFHQDFDVKKMPKFEAWQVSFSLLQFNSVAEQKEQRAAPKNAPVADSVTGQVISAVTEEGTQETSQEEKKGFIWGILKTLDDALAPE